MSTPANAVMMERSSRPAREAAPPKHWQLAPRLREVMMLAALTALLFVATILRFRDYGATVYDFGDSQAYTTVAAAIRHWDFAGLQIKQFWGYPYAIAAVSTIARVPDQWSLLLVSCVSSFLSVLLAYRLWGGWVAALFAVLNFDWMQRSFLGGAEPLAVALIFGAFLAVRRDHYLLAALLAALSSVVRPLGIFCLIGIGVALLCRREYKKLIFAILIGAAIGALYVLPLAGYFNDPLATVHSYEGGQFSLFGIPLYAIIKGTLEYPAPWTNLVLSAGWILLVVAGVVAMFRDRMFRQYARDNPVEIIFVLPYLLLVFSYNYPVFARSNFARLAIPALPLIYLALSRSMPKDRRVLWVMGIVSPVLAAASAIGINNVIRMLRG